MSSLITHHRTYPQTIPLGSDPASNLIPPNTPADNCNSPTECSAEGIANHETRNSSSNLESAPVILQATSAAISTQYETETQRKSGNKLEPDIMNRLNIIDELIPKLSAVIESSEKNLKKTFEEVFQSTRVFQERGVSPIEELKNKSTVENGNLIFQEESTPQKQTTSPIHSTDIPQQTLRMMNQKEVSSTQYQENSNKPFIGDLLVNVENIRESRCLLESFQNELSQIKKDIQECIECNFHQKHEEDSVELEKKYCGRHGMYIPLLKMKDLCSRSDQISIFSALKTEISLKKELESQLEKISKLERELSKVKLSQNEEEIKTIEAALQFTKSYFNNLLVKQETERLLNEQQKIMKRESAHQCRDLKKCDKCSVEIQIHDILGKVRECINKDLLEARQQLKIQKMPNISIKKPLQIQNTLRLNIPPSTPPQECLRKNVTCETVFKDDKNEKSYLDREVQTLILVNKATSIETHPEGMLTKYTKKEKSSKQRYLEQEGLRTLKYLDKSTYCVERIEKKKKTEDDFKIHSKTGNGNNHNMSNKLKYRQILQKPGYPKKDNSFETCHKTPSELGFRSTVGTQCDSNTSFFELRTTRTVENQTIGGEHSSNYLFGFKEYLRDKSVDSSSPPKGSNKADVVLQVDLEKSTENALAIKCKYVRKDLLRDEKLRISKNKNAEQDKEEERPKVSSSQNNIEDSPSKKRIDERLKSIQRSPSLKKMIIPPFGPSYQHSDAQNADIQNTHIEPKYKIRRLSHTPQEMVNIEVREGDAFYKSLTGDTETHERRTLISSDIQSQGTHSISESNHTSPSINSKNQETDWTSLLKPGILEQITSDLQDVNTDEIPYILEQMTADNQEREPDDTSGSLEQMTADYQEEEIDEIPYVLEQMPVDYPEEETDEIPVVLEQMTADYREGETDEIPGILEEMTADSREEETVEIPGILEHMIADYQEEKTDEIPVILEPMTADYQEEEIDQIPGILKHITTDIQEEEIDLEQTSHQNENIEDDLLEYNDNKIDDKLPVDTTLQFDVEIMKKKQYLLEGRQNRNSSGSENDEDNVYDMSYKSQDTMLTQNEQKHTSNDDSISFQEFTYLRYPKISVLQDDTRDSNRSSKENTQDLETVITQIMNEKDNSQITEQSNTVKDDKQDENLVEKLGDKFNINEYDYNPVNSSNKNTDIEKSKNETVLSLFSPNYTLRINKRSGDIKGKIKEKDVLLNCPTLLKSSKMFKDYKYSQNSSEVSDDSSRIGKNPSERRHNFKQCETKTRHNIDEYESKENPGKISSFNYSPTRIENISSDYSTAPCSKNRPTGSTKITQERLEYATKCCKVEKSLDSSSILSSEGEVNCNCTNVSTGEFHHCPYGKLVLAMGTHPGIHYKSKVSSHIVLENERKHYKHWVTYYSKKDKKNKGNSCSSSVGSKES